MPETNSSIFDTTSSSVVAGTQADRESKVLADARALEPVLNDFWTKELASLYSIQFDPPDRVLFYRGGGNEKCGADLKAYPRNALYCAFDPSEMVQFDLDWFQEYLIAHPGGATTFLILAHEWGHAVQDTWLETGGSDTWQPPYRKELNADCLAAAFLQRSIDAGVIVEEAGDADAIFDWLYEHGNSGWLDPGTHGTRAERQQAFADGYVNGTPYCRTNY